MSASLCLIVPLCLALASAERPAAPAVLPADEARVVVAAIVKAAEENASRPGGGEKGDALLDLYVRRAAAAARAEGVSPRGFLLGLGVALDHSDLLRSNPLLRPVLAQVESDDERKLRLKVLGVPTLRGREDWAMHFAISAGLTGQLGSLGAESIGVAKEVMDAHGDSGFSFADLAADYAGIALAQMLLAKGGERRLRDLAEGFRGDDFLPKLDDLEDGIPWKRFVEKYGGTDDPRFTEHCEVIRRRVTRSPGFQPPR